MRKFKINPKCYYATCGKKLLTDKKAEYPESMWPDGEVDALLKRGFIVEVGKEDGEKIGVLIPTRGDRSVFLDRAMHYYGRQTVKPHDVEIVSDEPKSSEIDTTYRYRIGCERLFSRGCTVVFFWEDDDWYHEKYIERMIKGWKAAGKPVMFGVATSTYYHIFSGKYLTVSQPSAMGMLVTPKVMKLKWPEDSYPYLDSHLWGQKQGKLLRESGLCIGIKHGLGMVAGAGHDPNFQRYNRKDNDNKDQLRAWIGKDFDFYDKLTKMEYSVKKYGNKPWLSIVTRVYKRPQGLAANLASIEALTAKSQIEQIFIVDKIGRGLYEANKSFICAVPFISGEWVYLLDDDDFLTRSDMVEQLQEAAKDGAGVIFFRMTIKNGMNNEYYPTNEVWGKEPKIAHIGGSCFAVRTDIWKKHIHNFAHARCGDYYFIKSVCEDRSVKRAWLDIKMAETGKVSRGRAE